MICLHQFAVGTVNIWLGGWQNLVFPCPSGSQVCRRSSWRLSRRVTLPWDAAAPGWLRGHCWQGALREGIFAAPVPADDFPLWILPCLDAEELFREGCGDSLRFFVSKYLISRNGCPLTGDCESLPKQRDVWTSWRTCGL